MRSVVSSVRTNKEIWRLAEWLHCVVMSTRGSKEQFIFNKDDINESYNRSLYDAAIILKKRMTNGVFS